MSREDRELEKATALGALARELELDVLGRRPIRDLMFASAGRLYWTFWRRHDARDPVWYQDPDGQYHQIDGWPGRSDSPTDPAISVRKWERRAALWHAAHPTSVEHVIDWLYVSYEEQHAWLANVDEFGRPRKLLKFSTMSDLVQEADKWVERHYRGTVADRSKKLNRNDEIFDADLGAGYTLVRLLSPAALDVESARMRHCIGHGAYDRRLSHPDCAYYSVRDDEGQPVATLEILRLREHWVINQFSGHRNGTPPEHVHDLFAGVAHSKGWLTRAEYERRRQLHENLSEIMEAVGGRPRRP